MERNFYVVLGIPEQASRGEIHDAYRRLARAHHPDTSGTDSSQRFREIQEAWDTLGNDERRRAYDQRIRSQRRRSHPPVRPRPRPAPAARTGRGLHLELSMTAAEAASGGQVPLDLPCVAVCPFCEGRAGVFFLCPACGGDGMGVSHSRLVLRVPPGLRSGEVFEVPVDGMGMLHHRLIIHVTVR